MVINMIEENIIDLISKIYEKNQKAVSIFKENNFALRESPYNKEEKIINSVILPKEQNLSFSGVDAGFVNKQFNFANLIIIKEAGAVFNYKDFKLSSVKYLPRTYNIPKPYLTTSSLEVEEIIWNTSILRLKKEISLSKKIIETEHLDFSLIDGSIVPQYLSKPSKDSKFYTDYSSLISLFISLYNISKEKKVFLVGCIEDSRADRFFQILKNNYLKDKVNFDLSDSFLVFSLLSKNQRTCVFKYTQDLKEHPILKDFPKEIVDNLYVCYVKLSEDDYPLRLEFIYFKEFGLSLKDYTDFIVSNIASISSFNKRYIYPSPLIEADMQSRLKMQEIDIIVKNVLEKTKKLGLRLPRRESRAF
jgi:hypothetical protein